MRPLDNNFLTTVQSPPLGRAGGQKVRRLEKPTGAMPRWALLKVTSTIAKLALHNARAIPGHTSQELALAPIWVEFCCFIPYRGIGTTGFASRFCHYELIKTAVNSHFLKFRNLSGSPEDFYL